MRGRRVLGWAGEWWAVGADLAEAAEEAEGVRKNERRGRQTDEQCGPAEARTDRREGGRKSEGCTAGGRKS